MRCKEQSWVISAWLQAGELSFDSQFEPYVTPHTWSAEGTKLDQDTLGHVPVENCSTHVFWKALEAHTASPECKTVRSQPGGLSKHESCNGFPFGTHSNATQVREQGAAEEA